MPNQETQLLSQPGKNHLAMLGIYIPAFYIVWILKVFYLNPFLKSWLIPADPILHALIMEGSKLVIWIVPVLLIVRYCLGESPLSYLKLGSNIPKGLLWGTAVSIVYLAILLVIAHLQGKPLLNFNLPLSNWIGGIILVGIVEEIPYRGFLLQTLENHTAFWQANLVVALLFLLIHFPGWLAHRETLSIFLINGFGVFIRGLFFGWLIKRTDSLWAPIIFHMLNNFGHMVILP